MAKGKSIFILAAGLLLVGGAPLILTACGPSGQQTTKYSVTYDESTDYEVTGLKSEGYKEGETVSFRVNVLNNFKVLSVVRAGTERLTADNQGVYSFVMGNADVNLRIVLVDKDEPTFDATYTGTPEVGQTLTIQTTINGVANNTFEVTATTGANLVTISGHEVTLNYAGNLTLHVTATYDVFSLAKDISLVIAESESQLGTNVFYYNGDIINGGEGIVNANAGAFVYWYGDGGYVDSLTLVGDEYVLNYTGGWAWYGVQIFYRLPYAANGDTYKLRWDVNSDVAGDITITGNVVSLQAGNNNIALDIRQGNQSTISFQLGVNDGSSLGGGLFKFKAPRLYDSNTANTYHEVTFSADEVLLKSIQVKNNNTVVAPEAPEKDNMILEGFYDGETAHTASLVITKPYAFVARYIEKSSETISTVTIKDYNGNTVTTVEVAKGSQLTLPTNLDLGFGKQITGLFTDQALTTPFDTETSINDDMVIFAKINIVFESTYLSPSGKAPDEWFTYANDGSVTTTFNGWGSGDKWHIQLNFTKSLKLGETGKRYAVTFVYSINKTGANSQIYDNGTISAQELTVGTEQTITLEYDGGVLSSARYLTFEMGSTPLNEECVFTLHSIDLAEKL